MGSGRRWAWNPDTGGSTTDAGGLTTDAGGLTTDAGGLTTDTGGLTTDTGGLTTDAGTLRMQDFLTRGTSCSGRALIRCHSRKTRPSCRSGSNIRSVAAASAALTTDCPRCHRNPAFWAHRLVYKTWKATLPPCCTQPEVKKQTISHDIARLSLPGLR